MLTGPACLESLPTPSAICSHLGHLAEALPFGDQPLPLPQLPNDLLRLCFLPFMVPPGQAGRGGTLISRGPVPGGQGQGRGLEAGRRRRRRGRGWIRISKDGVERNRWLEISGNPSIPFIPINRKSTTPLLAPSFGTRFRQTCIPDPKCKWPDEDHVQRTGDWNHQPQAPGSGRLLQQEVGVPAIWAMSLSALVTFDHSSTTATPPARPKKVFGPGNHRPRIDLRGEAGKAGIGRRATHRLLTSLYGAASAK